MQTHTLSCANSGEKIAENNIVDPGQHTALAGSICYKPVSLPGAYSLDAE